MDEKLLPSTMLTSAQWINSVQIKSDIKNTVIVKTKLVTIDKNTREVLKVKNKFDIIDNPKRTIYVTKPQYRTHKYKRDVESLEHVDAYVVEDQHMVDDLKKILGHKPWERLSLTDLCDSPYIYNADVSMEVLIRDRYISNQKHDIIPLKIGSFDIETSVLGDDQVNCITFIAEKKIYTAVLSGFMWKFKGNQKVKATVDDIYKQIHKDIQPYLDKYGFEVMVREFDKEMDLLRWIFAQIHREEADFICIWNMGFDIPKILERLKFHNVTPEEIFCSPSLAPENKVCYFKEDKRKTQHITEKWHWFYCTSMSQFVDSMGLYARIRKAKSKEPSYTLDAISTKEVGSGKLKFNEGSHYEMQTKRFVEYVVYNMVDAILLMLMEWQNHDISQMMKLTDSSKYADFNKQTVMLKNIYYKFCLDRGYVFATTGKHMVGPYDDRFVKRGGAVLKADLVKGIGINAIKERPDYESMIVPVGADLDFKAYYPSTQSMYGISKDNKLCTLVGIEGGYTYDQIEALCGGIASPQANAVWIGHDYFGLPSYEEWDNLFGELILKK